ncbi:hypothetical protein EV714DRAFT_220503, partial [Schizophyllum commune]
SSTAMPSTPQRCGAHCYPCRKVDHMKRAVREEIEGNVCSQQIPLVEFLKTVFELDSTTVEQIQKATFTLPEEPLQKYKDIVTYRQHERRMYKPFKAIFEGLVKTCCDVLGIDSTKERFLSFWEKCGDYIIRGVGDSQRKPDGLIGDEEAFAAGGCIDWRIVFQFFEFKKKGQKGDNALESVPEGEEQGLTSDGGTSSAGASASHKRARIEAIAHEVQASVYALECMDAETSRRYVTSVCIDGYDIWIMYHNRDRVFRTTRFNFLESPHLLALVAYAFVRCTAVQAGFDPLLHFPVKSADGTIQYTNDVAYPRELAGARFVFPEGQGQPASTFIIQSPAMLFRYMGLLGRGTMVYAVKLLGDDTTLYVLKVCYTSHGRTPEPEYLEHLKKMLPDMTGHFPAVQAWRKFEPPQLCGILALLDEAIRDTILKGSRTLVYQVTQYLKPLWELENVEEFKRCYVDLLEMHFHAYTYGRVLHRDVSENNAMSRREDDGKVVGFLNDWDLGCFVNADGVGEGSTSQHRTGTTPFMAIDLQRQTGGKSAAADHRYCHDLESFFWLLLWAVVHFDLTNKRRLNCINAQWAGSWEDSLQFKRDCLNNGDVLEKVLDNALDMWEDVVMNWVWPLARMLDDARQSSKKWVSKNSRVFDDDAYAKKLTFEVFMETIEQTPRTWAHEEKET